MDSGTIESLIIKSLPDAAVRIEDPRGDAAQYEIHVTSPSFSQMTRLDRHRAIHAALRGLITDKTTPFSIHTHIP